MFRCFGFFKRVGSESVFWLRLQRFTYVLRLSSAK